MGRAKPKRPEADVKLSIERTLPFYCPEVIAIERIFTGVAKSAYSSAWIKGATKGTPDLFAILRYEGGHVLFIECKSQIRSVQSDEQKMFQFKIDGMTNVHYILAKSVKDVVDYVKKNILDKTLSDRLSL